MTVTRGPIPFNCHCVDVAMAPQIETAYQTGAMPSMLPALGEGS